ncbi:MAG TPA: hypothetical protein VIZ31_10455 [Vicinamibacteria bacterium]
MKTWALLAGGPFTLIFGLLATGAGPRAAFGQEAERPPLTVFFADGSSQPLRAWSLAYEYMAWPKGESPARGAVATRETVELLVGKKVMPATAMTLELQYAGTVARGLSVLGKDGKRSSLKIEPPPPDALVPQLGKDVVVQARVLDLRGETFTGGKRSFCLFTYTALVECAADPGERVVKIQFP